MTYPKDQTPPTFPYDPRLGDLNETAAFRDYAARVAELEAEGLTTSDAQAVAGADLADPFYGADSGPMDLPDVSGEAVRS